MGAEARTGAEAIAVQLFALIASIFFCSLSRPPPNVGAAAATGGACSECPNKSALPTQSLLAPVTTRLLGVPCAPFSTSSRVVFASRSSPANLGLIGIVSPRSAVGRAGCGDKGGGTRYALVGKIGEMRPISKVRVGSGRMMDVGGA
jgi:hypothetical protein